MRWVHFRGGCELSLDKPFCGLHLGWDEMVFGVKTNTHAGAGLVLLEIGVGPLWFWVNIGG